MIMNKDVFLERLYTLFRDDKISDAATILETLRDEMYTQEAEHEKHLMDMVRDNPPLFGIARMGLWNDVDAGGTFRQRLIAKERYRVREQDIPAFAKEHGIKQAELWAVLRGERLETGEWRAFEGRGLNSKVWIDRSAKVQQLAEDRAEDEKVAAHTAEINRSIAERGATPQEPKFVDYVPGNNK